MPEHDYAIVTPEQLADGYVVRAKVPLGTDGVIEGERREYVVVRMLEDGNYLVKDPGVADHA